MLRNHVNRIARAATICALTCGIGLALPAPARATEVDRPVTLDADLLPRLQHADVARARLYRHVVHREWAGAGFAAAVASHPSADPHASTTAKAPSLNGGVWGQLAHCEATDDWTANTGNGFEGGLQFDHGTWVTYGGLAFAEHAYNATPAQQIIIAERVLARQGWLAWPACSAQLGLR